MAGIDKKAAQAAYKDQKTVAGVFAIRCVPTGQVWVGEAPNIDTIKTRFWFSLRQGGTFYPALQAAWNAHGAEAMTFEVLDRVDEESALARRRVLKEQVSHWREQLGAAAI